MVYECYETSFFVKKDSVWSVVKCKNKEYNYAEKMNKMCEK